MHHGHYNFTFSYQTAISMGQNLDRDHNADVFGQSACKEKGPMVAILLATYNGEKYLSEQLDSIANQTHKKWKVWASDDGSSDDTVEILEMYQQKWGKNKLQVLPGPARGFAANF